MGKTTAIEWTNATYNPWIGCHKVSQGCKNCYMFRDMKRYGKDGNVVTRTKPGTFNAPLKWSEPQFVFTCSWSDFFIEEADDWRGDAWDIIRRTPHLTYQVLTKRPERVKDHLPADWGEGYPNVWLGTSTENQEQLLKRLPYLLGVPARVRFLSAEPLLGPLDILESGFWVWLYQHEYYQVAFPNAQPPINWIITGGESGAKDKIRPAQLDWFRSIRDQCQEAGIAYFHKQHGGSSKINKIWGGRELDGRTWDEMPVAQG